MFAPSCLQPNPAVLCSSGSDLTGFEHGDVHMDTEARGQTEWEASRVASSQLLTEGNFEIQNIFSCTSLTLSVSGFLIHLYSLSCLLNLYICTLPVSSLSLNTPPSLNCCTDFLPATWRRQRQWFEVDKKSLHISTSNALFPVHSLHSHTNTNTHTLQFFIVWDLSICILGGRQCVHTARYLRQIHSGPPYIISKKLSLSIPHLSFRKMLLFIFMLTKWDELGFGWLNLGCIYTGLYVFGFFCVIFQEQEPNFHWGNYSFSFICLLKVSLNLWLSKCQNLNEKREELMKTVDKMIWADSK